MQELQYILLVIFAVIMAITFMPIGKYKEFHLLIFGGVLSAAGILLSIVLGRNAVDVILLKDTWGPGRGVVLGYAIFIGVLITQVSEFKISK